MRRVASVYRMSFRLYSGSYDNVLSVWFNSVNTFVGQTIAVINNKYIMKYCCYHSYIRQIKMCNSLNDLKCIELHIPAIDLIQAGAVGVTP